MVGGEPFRGRRKGDARAKKARAEGGASCGETPRNAPLERGANAAAVGGVKEKNARRSIFRLHTTHRGATIMVSNLSSLGWIG